MSMQKRISAGIALCLVFCLILAGLTAYQSKQLAEIAREINGFKTRLTDLEEREPCVVVVKVYEKNEQSEEPAKAEEAEVEPVSLGEFELTAYCPCKWCCDKDDGITATGTDATEGRTIAVDPKVIPYGTTVTIDGNEYIAEDCGGAIKGKRIDVYFDSHADAREFGRQFKEVFVSGLPV